MTSLPGPAGFWLIVHPFDHEPPHVHAHRGRLDIKVLLKPGVEIISGSEALKRNEASALLAAVRAQRAQLMAMWNAMQKGK